MNKEELLSSAVITTERLILNRIVEDDAEFILRLRSDPVVVEFIGNSGVVDIETAKNYIRSFVQESYKKNGYGIFIARLKDTLEPVGTIGLVNRPKVVRDDEVNIGYSMLGEYSRKGLCYEASLAVKEYGLRTLGLYLVGTTMKRNPVSRFILEKLGFKYYSDFKIPEWPQDEFIILLPSANVPEDHPTENFTYVRPTPTPTPTPTTNDENNTVTTPTPTVETTTSTITTMKITEDSDDSKVAEIISESRDATVPSN